MNTSLIMVSVMTVVGVNEAKQYQDHKALTMEPVVSGFIAGVFMFALDAVSPEVAKWFAVLVIVGTVLKNADPLAKIFAAHS